MMSEAKRKKLSGSEYKKKRLAKEVEQRKLSGALDKFISTSKPSRSNSIDIEDREFDARLEIDENVEQEIVAVDTFFISSDPVDWQDLGIEDRQLIIERGPSQIRGIEFPKDINGRHFSESFYERIMSNGEKLHRRWLIYSTKSSALFCFCCTLFLNIDNNSSSWCKSGYNDWRNAGRAIKMHESSIKHIECFQKWMELDLRLKSNTTIDAENLRLLKLERQHWRDVLKRIISVIQLCSSQMLGFRGNTDKLYSHGNGNFLKILELLAKFHPVTSEHLRRASKHIHGTHYMSKDIQNNLIFLLGQKVRYTIVEKIKESKYYSILLDCTPDISKIEQMSLVIRIVTKDEQSEYIPKEYFIKFLPVQSSTGANLTEVILEELNALDIKLENMRGQGYDNGANMKGVHSGVQKRILKENPKAFFVPCSCHFLSLVVNDAAGKSGRNIQLLLAGTGIICFLSSSTQRWAVLKKFVRSLTLKSVSTTRWESRIDAVTPLRYELGEIYDALVEITLDDTKDNDTRNKSKSLANKIGNFKFVCSVIIWYDVLTKINIASKLLQSPTMVLSECVNILKSVTKFLEEYRTKGFTDVLCSAKAVSEEMEITAEFEQLPAVRIRCKRRQFEYEGEDTPVVDPLKKFEIEFFNYIVDICVNSVKELFTQLEFHSRLFEFLYDIQSLAHKDTDVILKYCRDLHQVLTDDLEPQNLHSELLFIRNILKQHDTTTSSQSFRETKSS